MKLFISGWAGFREAVGDIPADWHFICPFLDFDEEGILNFLKNKSGEIVVGWSTGGHIVLKNLDFFSQRFEEVFIIAGFTEFIKYVDSRILRKMQRKMEISPEDVIEEFLLRAGCIPKIPQNVNFKKLIQGLEFLQNSKISQIPSCSQNLTLIQGTEDKILPIRALEDLSRIYPFAKIYRVRGSHWIKFREFRSLKNSFEAPDKL